MLHQIGNGALGPVFRAYDQDRDRLVAVKLFRLDLPPERVHQLLGEFEKLIAVELQHPVIAAPRAAGIDGNSAYLAQDFAAADSLDIVIRENGAAPPAQAVRVAVQIAEALDYAAERQIVHGALHPRDILLSDDDIRVVGLGVARALERVGAAAAVRRPYAPPERINDAGWDRTADVFSLAAIVYELLCGKRITGTGSEAAESLTEVPGADMDALQRVFALALAADPSYRYATATAFTDALKDAMGMDAAPAKPKAKRVRAKLKVVESEPGEPVLPLDAGVLEVPEVPELPEVSDIEAVAESAPVRPEPRRRRAPAPTPVAIESAVIPATEPAEALELRIEAERVIEAELTIHAEPVVQFDAIVEASPEVELPLESAAVEARPLVLGELEQPAPEAIEEPRHIVETPVAESATPRFLVPDPVFASAPPPPHTPSPVWPIGVAAVIGIALGFGGGYTVALRDRAGVVPTTAVATAVSAVPAAQEPPAAVSPKALVDSGAPKADTVAVAPKPAEPVAIDPPTADARGSADGAAFAGRVLVRSNPSGARVIVDGKDRGQTPATIRELSRGEHHIRIARDGYTTTERRIMVSQPSQSLSVRLAKGSAAKPSAASVGTLIVESRPQGAAVMVDGRRVGSTPVTLPDVRAGNHAIRLERDGYRIWTSGVSVSAGDQNRVTASLEKP